MSRPKRLDGGRLEISLTRRQAAALSVHADTLGCSSADLVRQLIDLHVPGLAGKKKGSRNAA
jgi:hypothetical protein